MPFPLPLLPGWDLSHFPSSGSNPKPGPSRPPSALPPDSLKAGVVWEEFRHGRRWGWDRRKRRKGGDLYTELCAGSAGRRAKAVQDACPGGAPQSHSTPPTSCSRPAVLQAALPLSPLPSPQGCTQRIKTTIGLYMTPSGDVDFLSCPLEVSCSHLGHDQSPKFPDPSMLAEPGTLSLESTLLPPPPPRPGRPVGHQAPAENMAVWYQGKHCT
jgi:hypothetical protein